MDSNIPQAGCRLLDITHRRSLTWFNLKLRFECKQPKRKFLSFTFVFVFTSWKKKITFRAECFTRQKSQRKRRFKLIVSLIKHETFYCQRDFIVSYKLPARFIFANEAYALIIMEKFEIVLFMTVHLKKRYTVVRKFNQRVVFIFRSNWYHKAICSVCKQYWIMMKLLCRLGNVHK